VVDILHGCRVFHFHDTSANAPVKRHVSTADNLTLRDDAGNLAAVLLALRDEEPSSYRRIVGAIRQVAPFFRDFVLLPEKNDSIRLRWREADSDAVFSANQMSDGTLRFICLATLLLQPTLPALVVLDEPELGLHPYAIVQLAGLLRQAGTRSQVLIATQSVTLMNQFAVDDLIVVERHRGESRFTRPDRGRLEKWLHEYSLGELWEKNLIGGRPGDTGADD
jgi:predicted ATPase